MLSRSLIDFGAGTNACRLWDLAAQRQLDLQVVAFTQPAFFLVGQWPQWGLTFSCQWA